MNKSLGHYHNLSIVGKEGIGGSRVAVSLTCIERDFKALLSNMSFNILLCGGLLRIAYIRSVE